jgi:alkylhydroperoxidase family enzyme
MYSKSIIQLEQNFLNASGDSENSLRDAILTYAKAPTDEHLANVPEIWQVYVQKVVHNAYKVTDRDIETLIEAGYSDDFIFEVTVAAAMGAGLFRLIHGFKALEG